MKSRWVHVRSWGGPAPAVGDRLRSRRGRYLITEIHFDSYLPTPKRLRVIKVEVGSVEGGREHPWTWDKRRGRAHR